MSYDTNILRLPDPNTNPEGPGFTAVSLTSNVKGTSHELNTGSVVSVKTGGAFWTMSIAYPELLPAEGDTIYPTLFHLSEGFETFYIQLPQYINPKSGAWDTSTNTLVALGEIQLGTRADTIEIPNWSTRGGDLQVGDMIKLTNSNKIYQIRAEYLQTDKKIIQLNTDVMEVDTLGSSALEPNDIKFRVVMRGTIAPNLTSRGVYEAQTINLRENV